MSCSRRNIRNVHGILLLDKPKGMSSNEALQKVKRLYKANCAGHTGTLDPLATGMLPICLGEATKFSQFLLNSDKYYRVMAKLGQRTDTSDSDGKVIENRQVNFTPLKLKIALNNFCGNLQQVPSIYSALKYQGKKLYEYARQGIEVPRAKRNITVYRIQVIRFEKDELELEIHCSKGTYIRTIIDDLGELLGCGAHVIYLRRLKVANYPIDRMVTLEKLNSLLKQDPALALEKWLDPLLMPIDSPIKNYPEVNLLPVMANCIKQGQKVRISSASGADIVRITEGEKRKFIGVGTIFGNGYLAPRRLVVGVDN